MVECERLEKCPFFSGQMADMPCSAELMKQTFCLGNHKTQCARYQVASAGVAVPPDLFPHDVERARAILRQR